VPVRRALSRGGSPNAVARNRLRALMGAGLVDSFGLSLGWTVFNLYAVTTQGLTALGIYNAAMLVGIALSAPATAFASARLDGRRLLQSTAVVEAALRVGMFLLLLAGAPIGLIAGVVLVTNVVAWTGYAGMRAEVAAVDSRASAMTRYAVCIAAIEAVGMATAALLPVGPDGVVSGALLIAVIVVYAAALGPTLVVARGALVRRAPAVGKARRLRPPAPALLGTGFLVMMLASGPTFLAVGLAAELHGRTWVAAAAIAFTLGSLAAPRLATLVERLPVPAPTAWALLGLGMIAGWMVAPWHAAGLLAAQALAGVSLTALEGTMDAKVASDPRRSDVTAGLAWAAAARALGGSAAVGLTPAMIAGASLGTVSAMACFGLLMLGLVPLLRPARDDSHGTAPASRVEHAGL
jgi:hypothetical protein